MTMALKERSPRVVGAGHRFQWKAEDDPFPSSRPIGGGRKKATFGVRAWLTIDSTGHGQTLQVGRHAIMRRTGLPARDLRILDPILSYPSTVLGRERAIVISLEHIKAIITAHEVLLLNAEDPSVEPFVRELQRRILLRHHQNGGNGRNAEWINENDLDNLQSRMTTPLHGSGDDQDVTDKNDSNPAKFLPFEFIALEMCLEAACGCLENEAATLEKEAYPALDKLTSKISTLNLEHVRQIKSRLVALSGRVQKVRDELEHLLDDDDDMAEMYLTEKLMLQRMSDSCHSSSPNEQGYAMNSEGCEEEVHNLENKDEWLLSGMSMFHEEGHFTRTSSTRSSNKHLDVEELEMLLEAYFVQIDGTLNKLSTLREYVDDTEDYINIMLDDKQNHLLQMGVMLSTATLIVSAYVVLAGLFGMNIKTDLFDGNKAGNAEFLWTVGGGAIGSLFLYVAALAWCKHKRLLE